jgi:beta-lactam-binding protein with PASTA domain
LGVQILGHDPADPTAERASDDRRVSARRSPSEATRDEPRSTGPVVPEDAIGSDAKTLEKALNELGYDAHKVTVDSAAPKDSILATVPAPGDPLASDQSILLVASKGKPPKEATSYVVPYEIIGSDADDAEEHLEEQGISVETVDMESERPEETVVATYPDPGANAESGIVVLVVAAES